MGFFGACLGLPPIFPAGFLLLGQRTLKAVFGQLALLRRLPLLVLFLLRVAVLAASALAGVSAVDPVQKALAVELQAARFLAAASFGVPQLALCVDNPRFEGPRVPLFDLLDSLLPLLLKLWSVAAVLAIAGVSAVSPVSEALAIQFETLRVLAVATDDPWLEFSVLDTAGFDLQLA